MILTHNFIERKCQELEDLYVEIEVLEGELSVGAKFAMELKSG